MSIADRQVLGELVDYADVAVRTASQLRLHQSGRAIRDAEAVERASQFLEDAAAGGAFMSSGESANLYSTLRPLNWAADVRLGCAELSLESDSLKKVDYSALTEFIQRVRATLDKLTQGDPPDPQAFKECVGFFESLGETLGMRADQAMRRTSCPCGNMGGI